MQGIVWKGSIAIAQAKEESVVIPGTPYDASGKYDVSVPHVIINQVYGGGDNKGAFSIFTNTNTYTCFTHCGTGNVITLAYKVYNTNDFTSVVLQLIQDYNISIPEKSIKVKRR